MLEVIVCNLTGGKSLRYETKGGKKYLVVPAVIIGHGVYEGSAGPIYYPEPSLTKSTPAWNGMPVVLDHPADTDGIPVSASTLPDEEKLGFLENSSYSKDKQGTEAWIDEDKMKAKAPDKLKEIKKKKVLEVSSGVFIDNDEIPGEYKGKKYVGSALNIRPDHLAILSKHKGACSCKDGCGLGVHNQEPPMTKEDFEKVQQEFIASQETIKLNAYVTNAGQSQLVVNVISHQDVARGISTAMVERSGKEKGYWPGYIEDVYDDKFIYSQDGKYFKSGYAIDGNYNISIDKDHSEVKKHTEYRGLDGNHIAVKGQKLTPTPKTPTEPTHAIFGTGKHTLAGNNLNPQGEPVSSTAQPTTPAATTPAPAATTPAATPVPVPAKILTNEEYIATLPPDMQEDFKEAQTWKNAEKARLIEVIVANKANRFEKAHLQGKRLGELQAIAALAAPAEAARPAGAPPSYLGAGGPAPVPVGNAALDLPDLAAPGMAFDVKPVVASKS